MYKLRFNKDDYFPHQWDFLTSEKTINGLVAGFGAGKTHIFIRKTLLNMFKRVNNNGVSNGWIIYPTYDLAEELFVQPFKELLDDMNCPYEYNQSKHRFRTAAGNIKIYQLQKPQRIIGAELTFIGFDEFDVESWKNCDMAFKKAIGRMRGSDNCEIYIVTSPEGFHYTHKIFVTDANDDRHLVKGKSTDNTYLPEQYIKLLESNYDENLLKAYRDGEFVNLSALSTYHSFSREKNVKKVKYNPNKPIHIGQDFNTDPLCAVLWQQYDNKPNIRIFKTYSLSHAGEGDLLTERLCQQIKQDYPNSTYYSYPDATGRAKHSSARYSDIDILRRHFKVMVKHINPLVVNRVNAMNKALQDNMIVDPSCQDLINDFERTTNKPNTREIDKSNKELTHLTDALGYSVEWNYPAVKPKLWSVNR
jgi:hypothetical protein